MAWNYINVALAFSNQASIAAIDFLRGFPVLKDAYTNPKSLLQSWVELEEASFFYECHFANLTPEEWETFVTELSTPGKLFLPESGPVKTMFEQAMAPYFKNEKSLDECLGQLKNQLQLYISE